jgi:hypothetical protein
LRFSFCDDLFFTIMGPFLPDDITYELLRLDSVLHVVRHILRSNSPSYCNRFRDIFLYAWSRSCSSLVCFNTRDW